MFLFRPRSLGVRLVTVPWLIRVPAKRTFATVGATMSFLAIIGIWTIAQIAAGLEKTVVFPGHEGDGPFQLFNPLRRIAAGQTGGIDFQYFHGIGFPYLHYPIYALAGSDLFAAELSRYLINTAVVLVTCLAISLALGRRWFPALGLTALSLVLSEQVLYTLTHVANASAGVRSASPFLLFAILLAGWKPRTEAILAGTLAGLGFLIGVEHGLAAVPMVALVWLGRRIILHEGGSGKWLVTFVGSLATTISGLLFLIGGQKGGWAAVHFAFVEMPQDQFWYFGAPPNSFFYRWSDVFTDRRLLLQAILPLILATAWTIHWTRTRREERATGVLLLGLLAYGFLSVAPYFGYCSSHYLEPSMRVALTVGIVLGWRNWQEQTSSSGSDASLRMIRLLTAIGIGVILLVGPAPYDRSSILRAPQLIEQIKNDGATIRAGRCRMTDDLQKELDALVHAIDTDSAAQTMDRPPVLWSTYAGRLEAHYGVFHPACDYLIHAIGDQKRIEYVAAFEQSRPDYVITCRPEQYVFEEWLRNGACEFYETLLANYQPLTRSKRFVIWKRSGPWRTPNREGLAREPESPMGFTVPLSSESNGNELRIVEVEYRVENPLAGVPFLGGLPRYLLGPMDCANGTPISLPPHRTSWSFIVYPSPGKTPAFYAGTFSLIGGKVAITRVRIRPLPASPQQLAALRE